jgi:FkbM family methyltransferase
VRVFRIARRFFPQAARARAKAALFRWLDLSWTTASGVFVRVENYDEWIIHEELFVDGEYDPAIDLALEKWSGDRPLRVVDLGANVGFFILRLFDKVRSTRGADVGLVVTAVEPHPNTANEFRRRVFDDNRLGQSVTLLEGLAGQSAGAARLHDRAAPGSSSIVGDASGTSVSVKFLDLDRLLADDDTIDLIKCDIEGAELLFVEHQQAALRKTNVVIMELHDGLCDTGRCRQILATLGFREHAGLRARNGLSLYLGERIGRH